MSGRAKNLVDVEAPGGVVAGAGTSWKADVGGAPGDCSVPGSASFCASFFFLEDVLGLPVDLSCELERILVVRCCYSRLYIFFSTRSAVFGGGLGLLLAC
jgi:hypothetical protein